MDSFLKGSPSQKQSLRREEERQANWGLEGMCVAIQRSLRHSSTVKSSDDGEKNVGGESETEGALDGRKNTFFLEIKTSSRSAGRRRREGGGQKHQSVTKNVTQNKRRLQGNDIS